MIRQWNVPVSLRANFAVPVQEKMTGPNFADRLENRVRGGHVLVRKIFIERAQVDISADLGMFKERFDLRTEDDAAIVETIMEWLLADSIPREKQSFLAAIPNGEGKHSAQPIQTPNTILFIKVDNHLRVRVRLEAVTVFFQFGPQLAKIVDFTVEGDPDHT